MFCTQNNVFLVNEESRGCGNVSFCVPGGWGIDCHVRKKLQIPGDMPGGMVTHRIEPCIIALSVNSLACARLSVSGAGDQPEAGERKTAAKCLVSLQPPSVFRASLFVLLSWSLEQAYRLSQETDQSLVLRAMFQFSESVS